MDYYSSQITKLIEELSKLPGVGAKSAQRLAFHIINMPKEQVEELAGAMTGARNNVRYCKECFTLTDKELCPICSSDRRNHKTIMVVENTRDLAAYEKTGKYDGVYHVLHGAISPLSGIGPDQLCIKELLDSEQGQDMPEVCESLSYYEKIISTVKNYLDTSYQDATLEQAARLVSLSPNYLSKIMKEHSDTSFSDYLLKTRMENAARMLRDIGYKQYEIAYRVGYDNPKNFSRAFHQYFNMTPTQYRNCGGRPEPQL